MSDWLLIAMLAGYAFWFGHEVGLRRERKRAAAAMNLAVSVVEQAKNLKTSRRFTGEGPTITNATVWTIGGVGKFKVTLEEQDT